MFQVLIVEWLIHCLMLYLVLLMPLFYRILTELIDEQVFEIKFDLTIWTGKKSLLQFAAGQMILINAWVYFIRHSAYIYSLSYTEWYFENTHWHMTLHVSSLYHYQTLSLSLSYTDILYCSALLNTFMMIELYVLQ